ncbi:hypothetical protein IP91_02062 [Pseudoduganella lurida]|uniref:Uncharacterized protein n=1 Tax=Pseudoduganella lurida TaxID=1036180 RepID=A0A562RCT1_9BURK|nr:hypothetical protein [Pseudoduganella lurida]TWI66250.1 hypothetical protein IP91_02062 [Pseudoduganella lurida]
MRAARLLALIATLLGGCTTPYRPPQFLEADASFPGLIQLANAQRPADVLLVHGICTHDSDWAEDTVGVLAGHLAANVKPFPTRTRRATDIQIIPHDVITPRGTLRFQSLIWSPLTTPLKQQLCYDQTDKSPICTGAPPFPYTRPRLNARLKDKLMDDCLPDALAYQGVARDEIQRRMQAAIEEATADADPEAPLVVVAESLGSKMLFDTLLRMSEESPTSRAAVIAEREIGRMALLVMAANQIPLLHMADQPLPGAPGATARAMAPDSLQRLLQKRSTPGASRRAPRPLTLVAFSDPGDLLTYTLLPERYRAQGVAVYNVLVSNAPTYFGWLENPLPAHLDYLANPEVGALIGCGWPRSGLCK